MITQFIHSQRCSRSLLARLCLPCLLVATAVFGEALASDSPPVTQLRIEVLPGGDAPAAEGDSIVLHGIDARRQLLATAVENNQLRDVTAEATWTVEPADIAAVHEHGYVVPLRNGTATITASWQEATARIPVVVTGADVLQPVNFALQVEPIFTKFGCNGGGCHGKASGQGGFKLSLLGFEPMADYKRLVLESRGRRLFPAAPDQSLLLLKATGQVPHGGGTRLSVDSHEYRLLARWIAGGMPFGSPDDPVVTELRVFPPERTLSPGSHQQLAVMAYYSDGSAEDVTRTAQFESNNTELADVDPLGRVTLRDASGDVAIMVRYQGHVDVARFSMPLDVDIEQFAWPVERNLVDRHVFAKLRQLRIPPSPECDDSTFLRRVTLDLAGRLPTLEETQAYLTSEDPQKLQKLVDRLLHSADHAEYFAKKWSAILRNRRNRPGDQVGTYAFYEWLRDRIHENMPYDQFVREIITASGSIDINPAVVWWRQVDSTEERVEDAAQLFLGQRLQCARCHHHPFEKWSQQDYYQMAAFFSTTTKKPGPVPEEPVFVSRVADPSSRHPKSGKPLRPVGLDATPVTISKDRDARQVLAEWMTSRQNRLFAKTLVNRYWKHLFGVGIVNPEDDLRATNPPTNPVLLDALADYFVEHNFDARELLRLICTSSTYRLQAEPNRYNAADRTAFSRYYPKRLQAEVLLDAIDQVLWTNTDFPGMPIGTRAVCLPDTQFGSYFLEVFGQPSSTTACECERSSDVSLAQTLHLMNSQEIYNKLVDAAARPAAMAASSDPVDAQVVQLYLAAFSRHPTPEELSAATEYITAKQRAKTAYEDLVWAIINSKEFMFNH